MTSDRTDVEHAEDELTRTIEELEEKPTPRWQRYGPTLLSVIVGIALVAGFLYSLHTASEATKNRNRVIAAALQAQHALILATSNKAAANATKIQLLKTQRAVVRTNRCLTKLATAAVVACLRVQPGAPGARGLGGVPGTPGPPGKVGTAGLTGLRGRVGARGKQGTPGSGTQGKTGVPGDAGAQGKTGAQGDTGAGGAAGSAGAQGQPGATGADGQPGAQGPPGADGAPGATGPPIASFTFTDGTGISHTCTSPDGTLNYTCT